VNALPGDLFVRTMIGEIWLLGLEPKPQQCFDQGGTVQHNDVPVQKALEREQP
jgi:hypothetical protein